MPNNKIIPKVVHCIHIGEIDAACLSTLEKMNALYRGCVINFWTMSKLLSPEKHRCLRKFNIKVRNIEEDTDLENHSLIMSVIDNPWMASDMLRLSILLKEPGFYFDLDITPKKALPDVISCEKGVLFNIFTENNRVIFHSDIIAVTIPNHPVLKYISDVLRDNLNFIKREEGEIRARLYSYFKEKSAVDYLLASNCTGKSFAMALYNFFNLPENFCVVEKISFFSVILKHVSSPTDLVHKLHKIPSESVEDKFMHTGLFDKFPVPNLVKYYLRSKEYQFLKERVIQFNEVYFAVYDHLPAGKKIHPTSLTNRLNKLTSASTPNLFFSSIFSNNDIFASAKLENDMQKQEAAELAQKIEGAYLAEFRSNHFFVIPKLNSEGVGTKVQNFLIQHKH